MADSGRDLILAPNEYAYISDETKGNVTVYVGPNKTSLAATDQAVIFDPDTKRFKRCTLDKAIQPFVTAPEGWYITLKNPAPDYEQPKFGTANTPSKINIGQKVNLQGPQSFSLWPGQIAKAVKGHHLRSNQYLLARVYNEKAALENWEKRVLKHRDLEGGVEFKDCVLQTGNVFVISGDKFTFFIPPTGVEVIADSDGNYRREAVTLERLEYCILKDEDGNKRFVRGPAVVFPKPTEHFFEKDGMRKFRAFELTPQTGVYLKVTAGYTDEKGTNYEPGEELFITGSETPIYFPRPEHAIIKYSNRDLHYAIAIPEGEARYVLNRTTGDVQLVHGPKMFLPDPRTEVIIRRVLPLDLVGLLYPGNAQAMSHNLQLNNYVQEMKKFSNSYVAQASANDDVDRDVVGASLPMAGVSGTNLVCDSATKGGGHSRGRVERQSSAALASRASPATSVTYATSGMGVGEAIYGTGVVANAMGMQMPASAYGLELGNPHGINLGDLLSSSPADFGGDEFERRSNQPRAAAITLGGKYEGAVVVTVWPGYAIQTIRQDGTRRTLVGPQTVMLEYDENLHILTLSSGTPKRDSHKIRVAYLKLRDNRVSDEIEAETSDCLKVKLNVSYWVDFSLTASDKWFSTENYVESLTDAMRIRVKEICKNITAEQFYRDVHNVIKVETNTAEIGVFQALGIDLKNIEVNWARIEDRDITMILNNARADLIKKQFEVTLQEQKRDAIRQLNKIQQDLELIDADTKKKHHELEKEKLLREKELAFIAAEKERLEKEELLKTQLLEQQINNSIAQEKIKGEREKIQLNLSYRKSELTMRLDELKSQTEAWNSRMSSVSPHLVAAINDFANKEALARVAESMAPMALLGGKSVAEVIQGIMKGTVLENALAPQVEYKAIEST
jgi:hypothetical protein